jgi:hypothetical protein
MDLRLLNGKWFAVLMIAKTAGGEDEWAFFEGTAAWDGKQLTIDRGPGNTPFPVPEDTLARIKRVDHKLRQVFEHAEYYVPLLVGLLPENADLSQYVATGMRWPKAEDAEPLYDPIRLNKNTADVHA